MKVRELIALLATMPQDAIAVVNLTKNELANGGEIGNVAVELARLNGSIYQKEYYPEVEWEDEGPVVEVVNITT